MRIHTSDIFATLIYTIEFTYATAYIHGDHPMRDSVALFKPDEVAFSSKYTGSTRYKPSYKLYPAKVKKEYTNVDYQNYVAGLDSPVQSSPLSSSGYNTDDSNDDGGGDGDGSGGSGSTADGYSASSTSPSVNQQWNLYANHENSNQPNKIYVPFSTTTTTTSKPATASNKIFVHHDDSHYSHDHHHHHPHHHAGQIFVKPTHIAKHVAATYKVANHLDDILHTKVLDKPLIQKLSLAKVALIQLISLLSSLSAIKTIHVVAKASHHATPVSNHIKREPLLTVPSEYAENYIFRHPHYPHTFPGMILHFVAQLSRFNIEAKQSLIPNLLKVASYASASSSRASAR